MHRTRSANLLPGPLMGDEVQQLQHLSHGDEGTNFLKSDAWHACTTRKERNTPKCKHLRNREEEPVYGRARVVLVVFKEDNVFSGLAIFSECRGFMSYSCFEATLVTRSKVM